MSVWNILGEMWFCQLLWINLAVKLYEYSLYQCTFIICSRKYNQRPIFMQVQTYNNNKTTYLTERCSLLAELLLPILLLGIFTLNNQSINKLSNIAKKSLFQKSAKTVCFSHSYSFLNVFYMKDFFTTFLFSLCFYMKIKCNKLCKNLWIFVVESLLCNIVFIYKVHKLFQNYKLM